MAWCRTLYEPMIVSLPTNICTIRPLWVKSRITWNVNLFNIVSCLISMCFFCYVKIHWSIHVRYSSMSSWLISWYLRLSRVSESKHNVYQQRYPRSRARFLITDYNCTLTIILSWMTSPECDSCKYGLYVHKYISNVDTSIQFSYNYYIHVRK